MIKKYENYIDYWVSEPDEGIYDAMNKGIKLANGDIIGFLNSDDLYASNKVIEKVVDIFKNKKVDSVYGDLIFVDRNNILKIKRYWRSKSYEKGLFQKGWHPAHPTFFVKKKIYQEYGLFNLNLKIAADYELMLRFLERYSITTYYIPDILVKMRIGGISNKNIMRILQANMECYKAWKINNLKINPLKIFLKPLSKITQYFVRNNI